MLFNLCEMTASLNKLSLVQDLAAVMLVAGMVAALFHYLGWPKVIGYIAAGALMGLPQVKSFLIANEGSVNVLANLGIIFLMFTLGLELNIRKLRKIGNIVFPTAVCDIFFMLLAGYSLGHYVFGWSMLPSLFLGAVVCDSSTTLLAKSLEEIGCSKEPFADVIFGTTLSEDILTIGIMALLTGLAMTGAFQPNELVLQLALLLLFLVGVLGFGLILLPKFLDKLKRMKDDETLLVIILGVCFGIAFVAEKMQFSLALGAFLVGAVVSESSVSKRVHESTAALRNMFSAVFFVTIGLMVNLPQMWANKWGILIVSAAVIVCKTLNCLVASFVMGQTRHDALKTGIGLAQIGDFAYLVALLGINLRNGAEPFPQMYQIAVGASIITTLVNPFMLRKAQKLANWLDRITPSRLLKFMENYTIWTRQASSQVIKGENSAEFKKHLFLYILDLILVLVLFSIAHFISERLNIWFSLPKLIHYFKNELIWIITCICCFSIYVSAFLHSRQMASALSLATSSAFRNEHWGRAMRNITHIVASLIFVALLFIQFAFLSFILLDNVVMITLILLSYVVVCMIWWKRIKPMAVKNQSALQLVFEREEIPDEEELASSQAGTVVVPKDSCVIGATLATLRLRNRTGVNVTKIARRDGAVIANPGVNDVLQEGDTLYLVATPEQIQKTNELLALHDLPERAMPDLSTLSELHTQSYRLPTGAYAVNRTLAELRLRNLAGTTVLRIKHGAHSVHNPGPNERLLEDDVMLMIGTESDLKRACRILDEGPETA